MHRWCRPDVLRDRALQEGRDDQVGREHPHRLDRDRVAHVEFERQLVAGVRQFDPQPLRQAVERMREQQDAHRVRRRQQMRGSCSPVSQSTTRRPPNAVSICTKRCGSSTTSPMIAASRAARMRAHHGEQPRGVFRRADRDQLALVGHVERIEPEELAGGVDLRLHRDRGLADQHADVRLAGELVQRGAEAAARGIAQAADRRHRLDHRGHQAVQRGRVGLDRRLEAQVLAQRHDRHAVVADRSGHQDGVAGARAVAGDLDARRHDADAGGRDEDAVALALFDDLGVAGDDGHAGVARGRAPSTRRCASGRRAGSLPRG